MPGIKEEVKVVVAKIPARCYLVYEAYMDWHLDHCTKPTMSYLEWSINRKRVLDQQPD
jgi:hypothetical protein